MTDDELITYFEGNSFWRTGTEPWPRLIALARIGATVQPQMFDMLHGRYLCFDPTGRWHGWEFYKHPDGQFVSIAKREWAEPLSALPKPQEPT